MRLLVLLWSLGPLLWQLRTSLLRPEALVAPLREGNPWTLANYQLVLSGDPPFWQYLTNSTLVGLATTLLTLLLAVPCAYGLQKLRGPMRWGVGLALAAAAMFPTVLLFLALLEIARSFGLANNLLALSLPYAALSLPLAVLLLRAAFADLPGELEDAARLEGLGLGQRLQFVLLPLLGPALASTAIRCSWPAGTSTPSPSPGSAAAICSPCRSPSPGSGAVRCSPSPTEPSPQPPCWAACPCWCWCWWPRGRSSRD